MQTTMKKQNETYKQRFEVVLEVDLHINIEATNAYDAKKLAVEKIQEAGFCKEGNMLAMKISKVKEL